MRAIHLIGPDTTAGLLPLCGSWGSMDTDWTSVPSEVTCVACVACATATARARDQDPPGGRDAPS
jgi:hypothetical protein